MLHHADTVNVSEARRMLPKLVDRATRGKTTIVSKHGEPCTAIVPIDLLPTEESAPSILSLRGTGKGLWGSSAQETIAQLRDEWS